MREGYHGGWGWGRDGRGGGGWGGAYIHPFKEFRLIMAHMIVTQLKLLNGNPGVHARMCMGHTPSRTAAELKYY